MAKALSLSQKVLGETHLQTITSLNNLALLYQRQGRYDKAEPMGVKALFLRQKVLGETHPLTIVSINNLAVLYQHQGRHEKAEPMLSKALFLCEKVLGETHPLTVTSLNNLASLYQTQQRYEKAELMLSKALSLRRKVLGESHPHTITSINNLALLYQHQGRYDKAEPMGVKALFLCEKVLGETHPRTINALNNLAVLYQHQGRYDKAELMFLKSLSLCEKVLGETHPDTICSLNNLAVLYKDQRRYEEVSIVFAKALTSLENLFINVLPYKDTNTQLSFLDKYKGTINYVSALKKLPQHQQQILKLSYHFKGNTLSLARDFSYQLKNVEEQEKYQTYVTKKKLLADILLDENIAKSKNEVLESEIEDLEVELSLFMEIKKDKINLEYIQQHLQANEYVVDFFKYTHWETNKSAMVACIMRKDSFACEFWDDWEPLEKEIKEYTKELVKHENVNNAKLIYDRIWQPLEKHMDNPKKIYLIPDSVLYLLPFKALTDESGNYLVATYNIVQLTSLHDLFSEVNVERKSNNNIHIFADPDYTIGEGALQFKQLPGTAREAQSISKIAKQNNIAFTLSQGQQATKNKFTQMNENSPEIIHIATHGYFLEVEKYEHRDEVRGLGFGNYYENSLSFPQKQQSFSLQNPFEKELKAPKQNRYLIPNIERYEPLYNCGLAFAGANNNNEENIIRAIDIQNMNLHQTRLVVLSACETAIGKDENIAGIYSLERAFHAAGVRAVLATLWSINDDATMLFMEKFYGYFLSKVPPQEALRQTQLEFIQSKEYNHPYYWAAFVLVGDDKHFPDHVNKIDFTKTKLQTSANGFVVNVLIILAALLLLIIIIVVVYKKVQYQRQQKEQRLELRKQKRKPKSY